MSKPKPLSEVLPPELREGVAEALDDYLDKPLIVYATREVVGKNGVYMRFVVSTLEDDKQFYLATGASQPVEVLRYLKENNHFPVTVTFHKVGRAIVMR